MAIPATHIALQGVIGIGQSNIGDAGHDLTTMTAAAYPHHVLTLRGGSQFYGGSPAAAKAGWGAQFVPYRNPIPKTLFPLTVMLFALERWDRESGRPSAGRMGVTHWFGNQSIAAFERGSNTWSNVLWSAERFRACAAAYGRPAEIVAIPWIHGENGPENYGQRFLDLVSGLQNEILSITGQAKKPKILALQTNDFPGAHHRFLTNIALDQLDACRRREDIVLAGPLYYAPVLEDNVHLSQIGRIMAGETLALCHRSYVDGDSSWSPLRPLGAVLNGDLVEIPFLLPPHCDRLTWDTEWVPPITNYGFACFDDAGEIGIREVRIDGASVRLALEEVPRGSNPRVEYALRRQEVSRWPSARGMLMALTSMPSPAHRDGYLLPATINHYAVRFRLPLTQDDRS